MDNLLAMLPWATINLLNIVRVAACILILGYSCVTDWKIRRAPHRLWYIMGAIGLILGLYEFYLWEFDMRFLLWWAIDIIVIFVFMYLIDYLFDRMGLNALGGADIRALIAITVLFPYYPRIDAPGMFLPVAYTARSIIFGLSVFGNALALNFILPISIIIYNLFKVPLGELTSAPLNLFTSYKADVEGLKGKHVRLSYHYIEDDGQLTIKRAFGGTEVDDETYQNLLRWKSEGKIGDKVWVTPKIPFLIPITLGFLVAVVWGDILTQIISFFLYR